MGAYAGAIVTNAGQNLIAASIANSTTVEFTRVESSSWEIPSGTNIQTLASLQDVEQTVTPSSVGVYNNNVIQVLANFDNNGVSTAYLIQTLGVWAKEGSSSEALFAVIQATTPDQMPVESAVSPSSFIYRIQMTVNNASTVNMTVSSAGTLTTADFDKVYKLTDWTTITSSEDLDNYTTAGNFVCATDAIAATLNNAPDVYAFSLKVEVNTVGAIMQIAREITGKTWFRCYTSSWSTWTVISAPDVLSKSDLIANLTTTVPGNPLDATMGTVLNAALEDSSIRGKAYASGISVTDCNDATPGLNYVSANAANRPAPYCLLIHYEYSTYKTQIAYSLTPTNSAYYIYYRRYNQNGWSAWQTINVPANLTYTHTFTNGTTAGQSGYFSITIDNKIYYHYLGWRCSAAVVNVDGMQLTLASMTSNTAYFNYYTPKALASGTSVPIIFYYTAS